MQGCAVFVYPCYTRSRAGDAMKTERLRVDQKPTGTALLAACVGILWALLLGVGVVILIWSLVTDPWGPSAGPIPTSAPSAPLPLTIARSGSSLTVQNHTRTHTRERFFAQAN